MYGIHQEYRCWESYFGDGLEASDLGCVEGE